MVRSANSKSCSPRGRPDVQVKKSKKTLVVGSAVTRAKTTTLMKAATTARMTPAKTRKKSPRVNLRPSYPVSSPTVLFAWLA